MKIVQCEFSKTNCVLHLYSASASSKQRVKPLSTLLLVVRAGPGRMQQLLKRLSFLSPSNSRRNLCSSRPNPRRSTRSSTKAQAPQGRKPWLLTPNPAKTSDNPNAFGTACSSLSIILAKMRSQARHRRHPKWIFFHSASPSLSHHSHSLIMACLFPPSSSPSPLLFLPILLSLLLLPLLHSLA